jgi:hypothetical protein
MWKQQHRLERISALENYVAIKTRSLSNPKIPTRMAKMTLRVSRVKLQKSSRLAAGNAECGKTGLDRSHSELVATPSDRLAAKRLALDKLAPAGDSAESTTGKDAMQTKEP